MTSHTSSIETREQKVKRWISEKVQVTDEDIAFCKGTRITPQNMMARRVGRSVYRPYTATFLESPQHQNPFPFGGRGLHTYPLPRDETLLDMRFVGFDDEGNSSVVSPELTLRDLRGVIEIQDNYFEIPRSIICIAGRTSLMVMDMRDIFKRGLPKGCLFV